MAVIQDIRFGFRAMRRNAQLTTVAALALAVGIGLNTTAFGLVNAVLIKGLPFEHGHEIVHLNSVGPAGGTTGVSYADLRDWRERAGSFEGLAAFGGASINLSDDERFPESINGTRVDTNIFDVVTQPVLAGRNFVPADGRVDAPRVAIIGEEVWERRYGRDPGILGSTVRANGFEYEVVGVMPAGMEFPNNAVFWFPIREDASLEDRNNRGLQVVGRLAGGVSITEAEAEIGTIAASLADTYPETNEQIGVLVRTSPEFYNGGEIRTIFLALMGAVTFVLLIACTNVANLQLTQALRRTGETAIRTALGANRARLVRQMLTESLMLAMLGAIPGLALAFLGVRMFDLAVAGIDGKPYWIDFSIDYRVLGYLLLVSMGTALFFGLVPALRASRVDINSVLKDGGRATSAGMSTRRWIGALVVAEVGLTLVLLVGAGVMFRSFLNLQRIDLGVDTDSLMTARIQLSAGDYEEEAARIAFQDRLLESLDQTPGIGEAAVVSNPPGMGAMSQPLAIPGRGLAGTDGEPLRVDVVAVSPGFFDTYASEILAGRAFTGTDGGEGARVAIVNRAFSEQYWPGEDAIGQTLVLGEGAGSDSLRVVGISPSIRQRLEQGTEIAGVGPTVYVPYREQPVSNLSVIARGSNTRDLADGIRTAVLGVDPNLPAADVRTYEQWRTERTWVYRVFGGVFAIAALFALVLSSAGVFSVTSYSVDQRTEEIGIRMALGATSRHILWLVARTSLRQLVVGVVVGGIGAVAMTRVLASLMFGVGTSDPLTFLAVVFVLTSVAAAASILPARRAMRLDPLEALRFE
jgi:predicted permease